VQFLAELRAQPNPQLRSALVAEFAGGGVREADAALLAAGRHFSAILLNLAMFRFERWFLECFLNFVFDFLTSSSKIIKNIEKLEIYYKMFKKYI
jgi:hypothetical protein